MKSISALLLFPPETLCFVIAIGLAGMRISVLMLVQVLLLSAGLSQDVGVAWVDQQALTKPIQRPAVRPGWGQIRPALAARFLRLLGH